MKRYLIFIVFFISFSCKEKKGCEKITVNMTMLDSVRKKADTSYTKRYRNQEFATAEYYVNRKDSTVCQLMKDSTGQIRQIITAKRLTRLSTAEYYSNGQLKALLPLDGKGRWEGNGAFYFENGCVKSKGVFHGGFYSGDWENYNEKGQLVSTDEYDSNGQLVKTIPAR